MIYYKFEMNYNQKKRRATLMRAVKKLNNPEDLVWKEDAIAYVVDLEGVKKSFQFVHPVDLLYFIQKYTGNYFVEDNYIIKSILLHDIGILGIVHFDYHAKHISKMDLAQLAIYEDNILIMIDKENESMAEKVKEYYAEDESKKKPKEIDSETISKILEDKRRRLEQEYYTEDEIQKEVHRYDSQDVRRDE